VRKTEIDGKLNAKVNQAVYAALSELAKIHRELCRGGGIGSDVAAETITR
jgi:hypothetical protein